MSILFFYISILLIWILFFVIIRYRPLKIGSIVVGIASALYSMVFEIYLGEYLNLYYYVTPENSVLYILTSALFIYPLLNIIYTLFLPESPKSILVYTSIWIVSMLIFEYISILTGTVVFTGWNPIPWSILTYVLTYTLVYILFRYINNKAYKKPST